jgi:hypothetical protein
VDSSFENWSPHFLLDVPVFPSIEYRFSYCRVRFHYTDLKKDFRKRLEIAHRLPFRQLPAKEHLADHDSPACKLCGQEERTEGVVQRPCQQFRALASACYFACYGSEGSESGPHWWKGSRLHSFAWIAADVLGAMKGKAS